MTFYVYIYRDPRKSMEPMYVGKGHGRRAFIHLKGSHNVHLNRKLNKIKNAGLEPSIEIIEALDEDHALFLEQCLIDVIGRADRQRGPLTNHTDGGEGVAGLILSEETRRKMSFAKLGVSPWNKGGTLSTETKAKVSLGLTGKVASIETRTKMSQSHLGKKLEPRSKEHAQNLSNALRGKKASAETKAKISEANKKRHADKKAALQTERMT